MNNSIPSLAQIKVVVGEVGGDRKLVAVNGEEASVTIGELQSLDDSNEDCNS